MDIAIKCIAHGAGNQWEAVCLDFDLAVQGRSLQEVTRLLQDVIGSYIEDALAQPEPARSQLLSRSAPFWVRLHWAFRLFMATLTNRRLDRGQQEATVGFPVECRA